MRHILAIRHTLLLILQVFAFLPLFAADNFPLSYLGIEQGLSNNSIRDILKDHKGYMWFATGDGLSRYDGYSFRIFRNKIADSNSLVFNVVSNLSEDRSGNLWIGTRQGVSIYDATIEKFTAVSYILANENKSVRLSDVTKSIRIDANNNVLIGTENVGLLFCKNATLPARQIPLIINEKKVFEFGAQAIKVAEDGTVWVFVQNHGLCRFDYATMSLQLINDVAQSASSLEIDGKEIWIGTLNGVYNYDITADKCGKLFTLENGLLTSNLITALTLDSHKNLWIGTNGGGVNIWNTLSKKMDHLTAGDTKRTLSSGAVYNIYEDNESRIWLGTLKGGVNIIDPRKNMFDFITHEPGNSSGLKGNTISSFYEHRDHRLFVGTEDAGLNVWDRDKKSFINYHNEPGNPASLPSNYVTDVVSDDNENLWVGTFTAGIARISHGSTGFRQYRCFNPSSGLENQVVRRLLYDSEKNLWATTLRQGKRRGALYLYNQTQDRFDAFDTDLTDLFTLMEDRTGVLWGGNLNELIRLDKIHKQHVIVPIGYAVQELFEDKSGNFWVGTEGGGLMLFDRQRNKVVATYTDKEGLCNNSILKILEDDQGNLWISTFNGLSKFDFRTHTFKNYYQNDGLQSNQFNYNAGLKLRSGEFVFGGIRGFNLFQPANIVALSNNPNLSLSQVSVNNVSIKFDDPVVTKKGTYDIQELKVPYNKAIFSFDFGTLEYTSPEKISYAYYLEGWDKNWNFIGNIRTALYTHVSEGTYTFHIKSTNAEGNWIPKEISIKIIVLPPWYRSWWAYILYIGIIGTGIYYYLTYKANRTKLQYEVKIAHLNVENERIERERSQSELEKEKIERERGQVQLALEQAELEKERAERALEHAELEQERVLNKIEREKSEKKLSFFTNISHEFRTPLTLIINPLKDLLIKRKQQDDESDSELKVVFRNARRMITLVDQLLLFRKADSGLDIIRPSKLRLYDVAWEVYLCFVQQAKKKNIIYRFDCPNLDIEIYADHEKLEIVLYNLISNAMKYTGENGHISISINELPEQIQIQVTDDGVGIPIGLGSRIFEKFYQPERNASPEKKGFGIGLFLVKNFTEEHKGNVSYESSPGNGTSFTLNFLKGRDHFSSEIIINEHQNNPILLEDIRFDTDVEKNIETDQGGAALQEVVTEKQSVLVADDDEQIRQYLATLFKDRYNIYEAESGEICLAMARKYLPDLIITDINMQGISGIDLCKEIKKDRTLSHIPVILLTASTSDEVRLNGIDGGADDYITKPFANNMLLARVSNLLKNRNNLQNYFYNEITLNKSNVKISLEYKEFLEKCIAVVEKHLKNEDFSLKVLLSEMGMSHSNLFRKVKSVSGQSVNAFIRSIRLRKAAEILIHTNQNVNETAFMVGIQDIKYFREQFNKLFGMNPSEYIKRYRKAYGKQFTVNKESLNPENP